MDQELGSSEQCEPGPGLKSDLSHSSGHQSQCPELGGGAGGGATVHQKLLWQGQAVTNMEDLLYEKKPVESSTPLQPGAFLPPHPLATNNNLTNIYHVVRPGQASYFGREHSETSLGR